MLLVVDIGNTHIVIGVYKKKELLLSFRMSTDIHKTEDEYWVLLSYLLEHRYIKYSFINGVIISSVVPVLTTIFINMVSKYFMVDPLLVTSDIKKNIRLRIENPSELGADRLVNAMAAYELYGGPVVVIDFGTATTFCAISKEGDYLGGAISPGLKVSLESLIGKTAKLPQIRLGFPEKFIGKNTVHGMQSGIMYGYLFLIEGLIKKFKEELSPSDTFVVATGGLSSLISSKTKLIDTVNPRLTLEGLRLAYELNVL